MLRKILLVEDDLYTCERVVQLLNTRFEVTLAHSFADMLAKLKDSLFECILLDLELRDGQPPLTLFEAAVKAVGKVLIFSNTYSTPLARECLQRGAAGLISKRDNPDLLLPSLESIMAGGTVYNAEITRELLGRRGNALPAISRGEAQTLDLLHRVPIPANKEIARILNVSESAVESRLRNLTTKFDAKDRHHLVHQARLLGYQPGPLANGRANTAA